MSTIDFDKFGHCVKCHRDLRIEQIIDGKPEMRFSPDYSETEYLLDNGSKMRVAVCKQCKETLTQEDHPVIMDCVVKGWKIEVDALPWSADKKETYLDNYSQLNIVCPSEGVTSDQLKNTLDNFNNSKIIKVEVENADIK